MACGSQGTSGQGEAAHARARRARCGTAQASVGQGRKELRFRRAEREGDARRPFQRQEPADYLPLDVRSGLEGSLPQLLIQHGSYGWRAGTSGATRRVVRGDLSSTIPQDCRVQETHGLTLQLVSANGNDCNRDYHVLFTKEELATGKVDHNFNQKAFPGTDTPGISVFYKTQ